MDSGFAAAGVGVVVMEVMQAALVGLVWQVSSPTGGTGAGTGLGPSKGRGAGPVSGPRSDFCGGWLGAEGALPKVPAGMSSVPEGLLSVQMPLVPAIRVEPSLRTSMRPPVPRMPTVAVGVVIW